MPTFKVRSAAEQVADHASEYFQDQGRATQAQMAADFGTTKANVRRGLRIAEPVLNTDGKGLVVPRRINGWETGVTEDLVEHQISLTDRLHAFGVEFARAAATEEALADEGDELIIGSLAEAIFEALQAIDELANTSP